MISENDVIEIVNRSGHVPIRRLVSNPWPTNISIHIFLATTAGSEQRQQIETAFHEWTRLGETFSFPPGVFGGVYDTEFKDTVFTATVAMGHANIITALKRLSEIMFSLKSVKVSHIEIG